MNNMKLKNILTPEVTSGIAADRSLASTITATLMNGTTPVLLQRSS